MVFPTAYLGPISYYQAMLESPSAEIEQWESFEKQTLRNRCTIAGVNGVQTLTVPVCRVDHKQYTRDVEISYQQHWQHIHLEALKSAYRNSPFYDYLIDEFRPAYEGKPRFLIDLNNTLSEAVMRILDCNVQVSMTNQFMRSNCDFGESTFVCKPYEQIFADKQGFMPNLSIVDLLFNMGNEAIIYLTK